MGGGYPPVVVNVVNQTFTPEVTTFGVPVVVGTVTSDQAAAWAAAYPDHPRTLEVSPNNWQAAMKVLKMTSADAHYKHLLAIFAQKPAVRVTKVILARRLAPVAQVIRLTVGGATDGNYSVQIDDQDPLVYAAVGKTTAQIRDALLALLDNNAIVTEATQGAASIDLTAIDAGYSFTVTLSSPGDMLTQAVQTPNTGIGEDLDAIRAENDAWFDILETSHSTAAILEAAKWAQTHPSHAWLDTNASNVKSNAAGNVAAKLVALGYTECSLRYHHTGAELFSAALCGAVLAFKPGQIQISHRGLIGITKKNYSAEPGVTTNFSTNNVGYYDAAGDGTVLYNYVPSGSFIELERNKWIVKAKGEYEISAGLKNNPITAYTDPEAIDSIESWIRKGINEYATDGGSGYIIRSTIEITAVPVSEQPNENQQKLKVGGFNVAAKVRIGMNEVEANIYLAVT